MSKERYIVAQIAVDEDGIFWLKYYGDHAEQGGMIRAYAWGPGSKNPEPILDWLVDQMEQHREFFVHKIKGGQREGKKTPTKKEEEKRDDKGQ